ncbi:KR domain-containing protein, partial [Micromonospora sp. C31]|uniref:type I polyketide synthase n=1 Tax=Micromonospora sp. C31 TaxID=2824876 RepID=UPI001B37B0D0
MAAGEQVGAGGVEELTLVEPLVLTGPVRVQVTVGPETSGSRTVTVHAQPADGTADAPWRLHATGSLTTTTAPDDSSGFTPLASWSVTDSVDIDQLYQRFRDRGIAYGPVFAGLVEATVRDGDAYGLVRLPQGQAQAAFGTHPALLDAALHLLACLGRDGDEQVLLPFQWTGVRRFASAATELRVRMAPTDDGVELWAADGYGAPVLHVRELRLRPATPDQLRAATTVEHLYRVAFAAGDAVATHPVERTWVVGDRELPGALRLPDVDALLALLADAEPPHRVVLDHTGDGHTASDGSAAERASATVLAAVDAARRILADERLAGAELVWLTRDAVCAADGDRLTGLAASGVWGLVRAARTEHPDRSLRLVDLPGQSTADDETVRRALDARDEPELAVRAGHLHPARLRRVGGASGEPARPLDPDAAVLVTGGTGELGLLLSRHLVQRHGVRRLVLTSRRGPQAPGAATVVADLTAAGATSVRVVACDVTDRDQVAAVLAGEPAWTGVFHLAAVLDDGLLVDQTVDRLAPVLAPKVDGAWHLHELTAGHDLAAFVLFSSAAGVLGNPGQSGYAAANTFLDALAAARRAAGLPGTSLSWGLWQQAGTGLTASLGQADLSRLRRQGIAALSPEQGLSAVDTALARTEPHLVPVRLALTSLQREVDNGVPAPALLRGLLRTPARRAGAGGAGTLRDRIAALPADERLTALVGLVRAEAAVVLGAPSADAVAPNQVFKELGLDSLMAVELRKRLAAATDVTLPATLAFDHPTPRAVAAVLLDRLDLAGAPTRPARTVERPAPTGNDEPIAIVAMGCRLPGADSPEEFWSLLVEGRDAVGPFPDRWAGL